MKEMLSGVSMESGEDDATFCNIYTQSGLALSNTVLGGLAVEDNLLEAMQHATFDQGYSYERFLKEFGSGESGVSSFTYNGTKETLSYEPVKGTDWQLTYLVRESVISDEIGSISRGMLNRTIIQSVLTVLFLVAAFGLIIYLQRRNSQVLLEREKAEPAENGRIALEKFEASPVGYYDVILMDMRMPEMDGLEATRRIRALDRPDAKTIPIVALTANAFDEDVQRSLQAGLNAHLSKPVQPEALFETMESLIPEDAPGCS